MKPEEFDNLLENRSMDRICHNLEKEGYRLTNSLPNKEFDLAFIDKNHFYTYVKEVEDLFLNKVFIGTIYKMVEGYEGITFLLIIESDVIDWQKPQYLPVKSCLFTNAPINREFEIEQKQDAKCSVCKKKFKRGELIKDDDKLYCQKCYIKSINNILKK